MKEIIKYEFKKLWNKTSIIGIIALLIISWFMILSFFIDPNLKTFKSNGEIVNGIKAIRALKNESSHLKGLVNDEYLKDIIESYENSKERDISKNGEFFQKYEMINVFLNFAKYGDKISNFNNELDKEFFTSSEKYYRENKERLKEVIKRNNEKSGGKIYSKEQIKIIEEKIDKLKDSFTTGYSFGLSIFITEFANQYWLIFIVILFALSSVFSKDSDNGIDEIILASKNGRRKSLNSRIISGNLFSIITYGIFVLNLLISVGLIGSLEGFGLSAQNHWYTCIYNITIGEGILLMVFMGLIGVLVITNLVMMISIIFKSVKVSTFFNVLVVFFLLEMTKTLNIKILQLNPLFFLRRFSITNISDFEIYHFIGEKIVPYSLIVIALGLAYLIIIKIISNIGYKRYRLN